MSELPSTSSSKSSMEYEQTQCDNEIIKENKDLKEEIVDLKKTIETLQQNIERLSQQSNTSHQDKKEETSTQEMEHSSYSSDSGESFIKQLSKRNKKKIKTTYKMQPPKAQTESQDTGHSKLTESLESSRLSQTKSQDSRTRLESLEKDKAINMTYKEKYNLNQGRKLKDKPPPINILYQDPKDTVCLFEKELKVDNFHIKRVNNSKHIAQFQALNDFKRAKEVLAKANTNFYSYTARTEKNPVFLLKGLNFTYTENEVIKELQNLDIEGLKFIKVSRFSTKHSNQNNKILSIFMVQLSADSNLSKLKEIRYLSHNVIYWEKLKKKEIIQCKRCQRLGHAAVNCNMQYRCVKCNNEHQPGECKLSSSDVKQVYCTNCNNFGYPASYRGCPKMKEIKLRLDRKNKQENNLVSISNKNISYVKPGVTYADTAKKGKTSSALSDNSKIMGKYSDEAQIKNINRGTGSANNRSEPNFSYLIIQNLNRIESLEKSIENIYSRLDVIARHLEKIIEYR